MVIKDAMSVVITIFRLYFRSCNKRKKGQKWRASIYKNSEAMLEAW